MSGEYVGMILSIMYYFTNYVIAVVSIYMGFLEGPPIMIRNYISPTNVIYFRTKIILILINAVFQMVTFRAQLYVGVLMVILLS